jgi:hypothetical protein
MPSDLTRLDQVRQTLAPRVAGYREAVLLAADELEASLRAARATADRTPAFAAALGPLGAAHLDTDRLAPLFGSEETSLAGPALRAVEQAAVVLRDMAASTEVAHLDLVGTELVVLSACDTGLGDVRGGEGVFGLQRAFIAAGAEAVLMSLWKVPDEHTLELMGLFYDKWLGGKSKRDAFAFAQQAMRKKYPDKPYLWAGFVLVGE